MCEKYSLNKKFKLKNEIKKKKLKKMKEEKIKKK